VLSIPVLLGPKSDRGWLTGSDRWFPRAQSSRSRPAGAPKPGKLQPSRPDSDCLQEVPPGNMTRQIPWAKVSSIRAGLTAQISHHLFPRPTCSPRSRAQGTKEAALECQYARSEAIPLTTPCRIRRSGEARRASRNDAPEGGQTFNGTVYRHREVL
jgi:hypothetical protein